MILEQAKTIKEAFNKAVDVWQERDEALDDQIQIVIEGKSYPLDFFAADMFQLFGSFVDEVIEVAEENNW